MITFQDVERALNDGEKLTDFVFRVIQDHKSSEKYRTAMIADAYNRHQNITILQYQKFLYLMSGQAVPDTLSANYKLRSNFFQRFVTQENQFLLGNGVKWDDANTGDKLGGDFDSQLQNAGEKALVQSVSFGFWNKDHVEVFGLLEFAPLWDEENGALRGGVRFWRIDDNHPLRATFYEEDGYTEFIWRKGEDGTILQDKRSYIVELRGTVADGMEIYNGENYPTFPIVPLWANKYHQSEFVGMQENIDCYDLIKSGFANNIDDASEIYWIINNAGGMDDVDRMEFLKSLKEKHIANVDDGQNASPNTIQIPTEARERMLDRLRADMYEDFMALDTKNLASGAVTATQIEAAYEPLNQKADKYEYCVIDFIQNILKLAGIEDNPTFTRSMLVNQSEMIQVVVQGAQYLSGDYVTEKILTILGDGDKAEDILKEMDGEDMSRFGGGNENQGEEVENAE